MTPQHGRETLPRSARVRSRKEFDRIFQQRLRASDRLITLYTDRNNTSLVRLGIAAGRRLGNAVARNRIKRLVREAFRKLRHELPPGSDWVVVPRPGADLTVGDLQQSIRTLADRLQKQM